MLLLVLFAIASYVTFIAIVWTFLKQVRETEKTLREGDAARLAEEVAGMRRALDRLNDTVAEAMIQEETVDLGEINEDNAHRF